MTQPSRLGRVLGVRGATVVGLGAMLGTGVFAVWTPALALAGGWLIAALLIAAVVAALNAVSTARLAMRHPQSGGAYAYGRIRLHRAAGIAAGIAFVVGKSASAAAAALTIGVYAWPEQARMVAWIVIVIALAIDLRGVVRSVRVSTVLVAVVLAVLALVVGVGLTLVASSSSNASATALPEPGPVALLAGAGLLFVAFAGYARITVLGEEVRDPARTIPRAMLISFLIVTVVYALIALVVMRLASDGFAFSPAPLEDIAQAAAPQVAWVVRIGAVLGAGAVLISLLAGVGRTLFAMAASGDAPRALAAVSARSVPQRAGVLAAVLAAGLVAVGRIPWALGLSAASILTYYAIAHAAAWTLPGPARRVVPALGILGCALIVGALLWQASR